MFNLLCNLTWCKTELKCEFYNHTQYSKILKKNTMWILQHLTVFNTAINNYKVTSTTLNDAQIRSKQLQCEFYNT